MIFKNETMNHHCNKHIMNHFAWFKILDGYNIWEHSEEGNRERERERERSVLFNDAVKCWDYMALVVDKWNRWSTAGMILTQENWNFQRETCPITIVSTTNPIRAELGSNLDLHGKRLLGNCLRHGTLFQSKANIHTFTIIGTSGTRSNGDTLPARD